jgi:hypothetical protein
MGTSWSVRTLHKNFLHSRTCLPRRSTFRSNPYRRTFPESWYFLCWAGQENSLSYGTIKFHCRVYVSSPFDPTQNQLKPVYVLTPHFCEIHFHVILSSSRCPEFSFPVRFSHRNVCIVIPQCMLHVLFTVSFLICHKITLPVREG